MNVLRRCERPEDVIISVMKSKRQILQECELTLFEAADPAITVFSQVLEKFYSGKRDEKTLDLLKV